jgi:hypothetical protein
MVRYERQDLLFVNVSCQEEDTIIGTVALQLCDDSSLGLEDGSVSREFLLSFLLKTSEKQASVVVCQCMLPQELLFAVAIYRT